MVNYMYEGVEGLKVGEEADVYASHDCDGIAISFKSKPVSIVREPIESIFDSMLDGDKGENVTVVFENGVTVEYSILESDK